MIGSAIVEVMIGLVFVYILMSLLASQINQIISLALNLRARQLRRRLEFIILDPKTENYLLGHPIVSIIRPPRPNTREETPQTMRVGKIAPTTLSRALINVLTDPYLELYATLSNVEDPTERAMLENLVDGFKERTTLAMEKEENKVKAQSALNRLRTAFQAIEPGEDPQREAMRKSLLDTVDTLQVHLDFDSDPTQDSQFLKIKNGVARVESRAFQQAMETIMQSVSSGFQAQQRIEEWFDNKLRQTNDTYARIMQFMSLFVGLVLALLLNIDSLHLALTLWNDPALRDQISVAANSAEGDLRQILNQSVLDAEGNVIAAEDTDIEDVVAEYRAAQTTLAQLMDLRLPIGWTWRPIATDGADSLVDASADSRNLRLYLPSGDVNWGLNLFRKILGIGVTAFAVAQGAPFWFDVLRRLSGGRSPSATTVTDDMRS